MAHAAGFVGSVCAWWGSSPPVNDAVHNVVPFLLTPSPSLPDMDCPDRPCYLCKKPGHTTATCPFRVGASADVPASSSTSRRSLAVPFLLASLETAGVRLGRACAAPPAPYAPPTAWRAAAAVLKLHSRRVTALAFHPDPASSLLISGDKRGQIGIWNHADVRTSARVAVASLSRRPPPASVCVRHRLRRRRWSSRAWRTSGWLRRCASFRTTPIRCTPPRWTAPWRAPAWRPPPCRGSGARLRSPALFHFSFF